MLSFFLLTLLTCWNILLWISNREYKKVSFLFSLAIIFIFYTPNLYFILGGEAYRGFYEPVLETYINYSSIVMLLYSIVYTFVYRYSISLRSKVVLYSSFTLKLYLAFMLFGVLFYYALFFSSFPTIHFLLKGELIDRPDLTGDIPFFFTMSTVAFVVLPSIYFFYFDSWLKYQHVFINIVIVTIFIAGGNKGLVVFYFIFLWLFIFNGKLDIKIVMLFFLSFALYILTKGVTEINAELIDYLMSSPFRRMFVTQGTCFLYRFDMMLSGYEALQADPRGIKFDVFAEMYSTNLVGSCPTFATGDIFVRYGYIASLISFVFISLVILAVSKILWCMNSNRKLFLYWNVYFIIFLVVMSGLEASNLFRITFVVINILLIYFLGRISVKGYL